MPPVLIAEYAMLLTGFTFGVIPAYERDTFILTVDVKQGDRVFKTYTYKDHLDSWFHLFLMFLTPFNFGHTGLWTPLWTI